MTECPNCKLSLDSHSEFMKDLMKDEQKFGGENLKKWRQNIEKTWQKLKK